MRIWEHTVEPRTVEVRITEHDHPVSHEMIARYNIDLRSPEKFQEHPYATVRVLRSSTPVPAPLHTCREARNHLTTNTSGEDSQRPYYRKAFGDVQTEDSWYLGNSSVPHALLPTEFWLELGVDIEPRYVWFNFEMPDMLSIGQTSLDDISCSTATVSLGDIKRLKLERERDAQFVEDDLRDLDSYLHNLQEIHFVCLDGIEKWALVEDYLPYGVNVLLIDGKTGETATPSDFAAKWDLSFLREVVRRRYGARIHPDTHVPFVPWLPPGWLEGEQYSGDHYYHGDEIWRDEDDDYEDWFDIHEYRGTVWAGLLDNDRWDLLLKNAEISRGSGVEENP